jgi:hypothetical protein
MRELARATQCFIEVTVMRQPDTQPREGAGCSAAPASIKFDNTLCALCLLEIGTAHAREKRCMHAFVKKWVSCFRC